MILKKNIFQELVNYLCLFLFSTFQWTSLNLCRFRNHPFFKPKSLFSWLELLRALQYLNMATCKEREMQDLGLLPFPPLSSPVSFPALSSPLVDWWTELKEKGADMHTHADILFFFSILESSRTVKKKIGVCHP